MSNKEIIEEEKGGLISVNDKDGKEIYLYSILPQDFIAENGLLDIAVAHPQGAR